MKDKFVLWVSENPFWSGIILAIVIIGGLVLFSGCTTTPTTAPPITPQIKAKTSEIKEWKVFELGKVFISNSTLAVYLVTARDKQSNIVFKTYVRPGSGFGLLLRVGEYQVCFKSSGIWGREKCFDKLVEPGKVNEWKIKRKRK